MTRRRVLIAFVILLIPVAAHAVWDQVEATLLAREIAKIARRHEPVNVAFQKFPLPTPEQRSAARVYAAAADLAATKSRDEAKALRGLDDAVTRAFDSGQPAEMLEEARRKYIEGEPAFDLLALASRLDFAGFGPAAPELTEMAYPLAQLNFLNCVRADILTAHGDAAGASDVLIQSIRLQRTIGHEAFRHNAARRWFASLRLLLRHAPPDSDTLLRLQREVEQLPDADGLGVQLEIDRARMLGDFWAYPPDGASWAARGRVPDPGVNKIAFFVLRPLLTRATRQQLRPFEEAIEVARQPWPAKWESENAPGWRPPVVKRPAQRSWLERASSVIDPPNLGPWMLHSYMATAGMTLAMRRTVVATLAVERYRRAHGGEPPATLSVLVPEYLAAVPIDPFSGQPLPYRLAADNYVVYSIAQNRADDGGGLYGLGSGVPPLRPNEAPARGGDIGIRVPLTPRH